MNDENKSKETNLIQSVNGVLQNVGNSVGSAIQVAGGTVTSVAGKAGELIDQGKNTLIGAVDANGNGEIDLEDFIIHGMRIPGFSVNRENFLRTEFKTKYDQETVDAAVASTPSKAGIPKDEIDKIADQVIAYERNCVSGISTALGMPGGLAMAATIPADIAQYYGFMLRAAQKLMYLYGFPQIDTTEKDHVFDSETINILTLCLGVMYGAAGANNALKAIANALATGVERQLMKKALTKGTIYPIVKSIGKWFGQKITKQAFAGFFKKAIPVVGGVIGGTVTFLSFKPCCDKLKESLRHTVLSDPDEKTDDSALIIDDSSTIE